MNLGKNTPLSAELFSYVDRIENINAQIKALQDDRNAIKAEAKARGYSPKRIGEVVRIRAMKPHDRQEAEAELDIYLHALGMASEPPLLRFLARAGADTAVRESVIDAMKNFVPPHGAGDITVTMEGKPVRLVRNEKGDVELYEVVDSPLPLKKGSPASKPKADVPKVDADTAEAMGRMCAKENRPVIDNPFPFGDERRARFDLGWRRENGGDGMGPKEGED